MKTYYITAYRYGDINEQFCLFASPCKQDCMDIAEAYPEYRGGKYGCGVFEVDSTDLAAAKEGDATGEIIAYFPSIHGEFRPQYNHRRDVFNRTVCAIKYSERYENECPQWIKDLIDEQEATADRLNKLELR